MDLSTNPFFTHGIDKLCTICHMILKDADRTHSIFSTLEEFESALNVIQVLQSFSNINIYDGPRMVCGTCYDKTIEAYKFIQMCNKAHENMQHYLKYEDEMRTRTDDEMNAISTTGILVDGRSLAEEVENEKIRKNYEFVISSTDIKIEEGLKEEETSNNEEMTISDTEIVTFKIEENDAEIHDERIGLIKCNDCHLVFSDKKELRDHRKEAKNTKEIPFISELCNASLRRHDHDQRHNAKREHISEDLEVNQDQHQPFEDHENGVMCPECQKVLYSDKQLKIHMRGHHKKTFLCYRCGKVYTTKYNLNVHIRVHTGEKPYTCLTCKRGYADSQSLRRHTDSHSGVKPYKCEQCDRRFGLAGTLRRHMDSHNGVKSHNCLQCDRRFSRASDLRRHMDSHNGVKAYKCEPCGRRFTQAAHLRTHMNIHNKVKAHKCVECDRSFTHLSSLRRHMMMHSGESRIVIPM